VAAIDAYLRALNVEPSAVETHYNLGCALYEQARYASAIGAFRRAIEIDPSVGKIHSSLGNALFDSGEILEARQAYEQALAVDPASAADHFNVGKIHDILGDCEAAAAAYRRSLALEDTSSTVWAALAALLHRFARTAELEDLFQRWLQAVPDDPVALHSRAAMTGRDVSDRAPDQYVTKLFDRFAGDYDATLHKVSYRGPQLVEAATVAACGPATADLDVLDAGCGTGLCGPLLALHARRLTGVDLSPEMIAKARQRRAYDELVEAELTAFMAEHPGAFDLIVAADTLNYFGVLQDVFAAAHAALRPGGQLIFTAEAWSPEDASASGHRLNPHGRYSHTSDYLSETLQAAGFDAPTIETEVIRTESGQPVAAHVVQARRT
jgi:predicted TPR repeat methyltransferase